MDRGAWQTTVHGVSKSWTGLSSWYFHYVLSLIHRRLLLVSQAFLCCPRARLCFLRDSFFFFFFSILIQIPWNSFQLMKQQSVLALQLARMAKRLSSIVKEKWKWSCSVMSNSLVTPWTVCSLPGSTIHGIFQARILEWVAISFSRRSSQPRDWTQVSHIVGSHFTIWATREVFHRGVFILLRSLVNGDLVRCWGQGQYCGYKIPAKISLTLY